MRRSIFVLLGKYLKLSYKVDAGNEGFCTGDDCDKVNGFEEEDISEVEDVEEQFEVYFKSLNLFTNM